MDVERDHSIRIRVRKRIQQHVLNHAEDGGSGPNAQRQRQNGYQRKPRLLAKPAHPIPEVLRNPVHEIKTTKSPFGSLPAPGSICFSLCVTPVTPSQHSRAKINSMLQLAFRFTQILCLLSSLALAQSEIGGAPLNGTVTKS